MCTNPARIYGLYPQKGILQPGSDGDLVILDPRESWVITHDRMHSAVDYTAYEGVEVRGRITLVMQRGLVVAKDGSFTGQKGAGQFIRRKPLGADQGL
ncbi:MAG: amidohydrolase family protein [Clostridium sp.]|nr:amidohydrolase family protein [Clostridium sp.]